MRAGSMLGRQHTASAGTKTGADVADVRDARLIARVVRRDPRAFEELYRSYHPRLSRFLFSILRRAHVAEEVLDDTLLIVWRRPERYNGRSRVSTWIFAIAYRQALKALRRCDDPVEDRAAAARATIEAGPEQQLGRRQAQDVLLRAIGELSPDHRAVIDLTYFHEIGYREIAELMDCPQDTVKTRMFHARRRLKSKLSGGLADWL
jgi:RNA polymerase sigma factor (sigma-70 family)